MSVFEKPDYFRTPCRTDNSYLNDLSGLVIHLRQFIGGYVLYDASNNQISRNIAYTYCAAHEASDQTVLIAVSKNSATVSSNLSVIFTIFWDF